jgi:putative phosphonate transport system ATP-binding protein
LRDPALAQIRAVIAEPQQSSPVTETCSMRSDAKQPRSPPQQGGSTVDFTADANVTTSADEEPLLSAHRLTKWYGRELGCRDVSLELYEGEVMAVVGESGSGKTTLLQLLSAQIEATSGSVLYRMRDGETHDLATLGEAERRFLARTDWGYVHQEPSLGLRMTVSAGANVGERLMAVGWRHYGIIRGAVTNWLERVELDPSRIDHTPQTYSGGMRQRLQIARNLVTQPRLVLMDEPTGGLDVSVQARLLDLLRGLVAELRLSAVIVTHDLGVARLLSHRIIVMKSGEVVEAGLTDQVLDDPREAYTQLLVASILPP